jgi:hypothetical protein
MGMLDPEPECACCGNENAQRVYLCKNCKPEPKEPESKIPKMGHCPKCGSMELQFEEFGSDIDAWADDTPFPTVTLRFGCEDCGHRIEVSYDRDKDLYNKNSRYSNWGEYNCDPDGNLPEYDESGNEIPDEE